VEFVRAADVKAPTIYVYDGAPLPFLRRVELQQDFGREGNKKVRVMREFVNAETNHLGIAVTGRANCGFYRRDADDQMEFVGEDELITPPRNETSA